MRQPHSSLVIWIQLVISYALGMRQVCEDCFPEIETVSQVCVFNPNRAWTLVRLGMCASVRPLCAEDPVPPLYWLLYINKYALGMRQRLFSPRIRMTLASMRLGYAHGPEPSAAFAVASLLLRQK